jgi:hypothetical protein
MKCRITKYILFLLLLFPLTFNPTNTFAECRVIRIMLLGDSITYDNHSGDTRPSSLRTSYRQPLWLSLQMAGYSVDFVGSRVAGEAAVPSFDPDNEGYPGWTAEDIALNVYDFLTDSPADIVLLHIGTNKLTTDPYFIEFILDEIDRFELNNSQTVRVVLARIINRSTYSAATTQFNDNVQAMAQRRMEEGDHLTVVDMEDGAGIDYRLEPLGDMYDNLHPNDTGYEKMAAVWMETLIDLLPVCDQGTPAFFFYPSSLFVTVQGDGTFQFDVDMGSSIPGQFSYDLILDDVASWLQVTPETGLTPESLNVSIDASQLTSGVYTTSITATSPTSELADVSLSITIISDPEIAIQERVSASADDAEQRADSSMYLNSSDLELVFDVSDQIIGMRFTSVGVPAGAIIVDAYVQFTVDEINTGPTQLTIEAEAADNASGYVYVNGDLSARARTFQSVSWAPSGWTTVGAAGAAQQTPDLSAVIQEVVDRPGWQNGNALALIITGSGERTAESYDGDPGKAPLLNITYTLGDPVNRAPSVEE